ncbi:hypothetical protein IB237_23395 [Agrobacterium sp. AGB01]|uniref:hypothetical protein n=1 Tax=Agrobacterium sp. AGB01 TaxID=2769302 RepID=UPI00177D4A86|nr:hypothetical protein [Agrobacterium sp. AGB01]MBD9390150.1 hypothetical protein [Agrobacterium sp. AGB01]
MSSAIRLYVVTDNAHEAAMTLLGCRVASLPAWMKVTTDPFEVERLPSGVAALGLFFPVDMRKPSFVETVWQERKLRGGIDTDREKHLEKLNDWMRARDASDAKLIADALAAENTRQGAAA